MCPLHRQFRLPAATDIVQCCEQGLHSVAIIVGTQMTAMGEFWGGKQSTIAQTARRTCALFPAFRFIHLKRHSILWTLLYLFYHSIDRNITKSLFPRPTKANKVDPNIKARALATRCSKWAPFETEGRCWIDIVTLFYTTNYFSSFYLSSLILFLL